LKISKLSKKGAIGSDVWFFCIEELRIYCCVCKEAPISDFRLFGLKKKKKTDFFSFNVENKLDS
jgi:hypothetical protein